MFRDLYADFGVEVAETIREGVAADDFEASVDAGTVTAVLIGSIDGLRLQAWFDPTLNPSRMAARFMDVVIRGLAPAYPTVRDNVAANVDVSAGGQLFFSAADGEFDRVPALLFARVFARVDVHS